MAVRRLAEVQPESFSFTQENLAWAERQIAKFPEGRQASAVIPILWRAQEQEGWVSKPVLETVATILGMPYIRVLEVATFYTMFHLEPVGTKAHVQVCGTTPCMIRGAGEIIEVCRSRIHHDPHHRSADGALSWEEVECLGACVNAPMVQIFSDTYEDLTPESFGALLDAFDRGDTPRAGPQASRVTSTPAGGLTSLTEVDYADEADGHEQPPIRETGASDDVVAGNSAAAIAPDEPHPATEDSAGGEDLAAEKVRRKGRVPRKDGGADPAGKGTADQEIARVDPAGRSDEAASRAMGGRSRGKASNSPSGDRDKED